MMKTSTLFFITLLVLAAEWRTRGSAFALASHPAPIQKSTTTTSPNLARLRSSFKTAVGKDFDIIKDELKQRPNVSGGGTYWLAHIKAKHSGYFVLNYRYNYNDPHYSHVERDFSLTVGPNGCRRGPPYYASYSRFCVGDTIIVPIIINNFSEHEFKLTSTAYTREDEAAFENRYPTAEDRGLDSTKVANPAAEFMRYVGSTSHKMPHRNGGYTLEFSAMFEAQRPSRFNLSVGAAAVPIIIVSRDTPVTLLASHQEVRGYSRGYDDREWVSSTSGDSFMTDLMILQPGDRISLTYHSSVHSRDFERKELAGTEEQKPVSPRITKLPFSLKSEYNFTEWLFDYLPQL